MSDNKKRGSREEREAGETIEKKRRIYCVGQKLSGFTANSWAFYADLLMPDGSEAQ
ncbi:hypothetical protein FOQG_11206 [Fusarium oxysporum f. sp. raphani 54005]|uniref:Uncharacterized protein n=2 Tax=Fusarium oxysporum TaxID=5507 RepID=X0BS52_FUSOX|nr:hypothetical protein FOVG_12390 [Fusarium oxysporum f. sp. pisi HDV247]EXK84681.1 hypothetical protein FOQG_11206 [Fusarium oxysporum f. sp. raphani 54005]